MTIQTRTAFASRTRAPMKTSLKPGSKAAPLAQRSQAAAWASGTSEKASLRDLTSNVPEVKALLAKYEPKEGVVGRPYERVLQVVAKIDAAIMREPTRPGKLADLMLKEDVRKSLFALEAQLRLYRTKFGKRAEGPLAKVKQLEDALGAWGLNKDLQKQVAGKKFPPPVVQHLVAQDAHLRTEVKKILQGEWLPDAENRAQIPALNKMLRGFRGAKWGTYAEDQAYLRKEIAAHISKIEAFKVDFNDLQGGIHELRRMIRWVAMYMDTMGGAFQLSTKRNPLPHLKKLLNDPEANGPFLKMPAPVREPNPILFSKSLFIANSKLIAGIGKIKDQGEFVEFLSHLFVESGVVKSVKKAEPIVRELLGARQVTHEWVRGQAEKLYTQFLEDGALPAMRRDIQTP
jgi:hypothetical protein